MMKLCKIIGVGSNGLKSKISKRSIGMNGFNFSRWIASKYNVFPRFNNMPALIYRRLLSVKNVDNSSCNKPYNNCINIQKFNNFTNNPFQKVSRFFSKLVISIQDSHTCTETRLCLRTLMGCYNLTPIYQNTYLRFYAISTERADIRLGPQNGFIRNTGHEKVLYEQINKVKKQFKPLPHQSHLYAKDIQISINSVIHVYLQKMFDFDISTNINVASKGTDTLFIHSIKLLAQGYLYSRSNETAISEPNLTTFAVKKTERNLVEKNSAKSGITKSTNTPSIKKIRTFKTDKNIEPDQTREMEKRFMPVSLPLPPLYTRNDLKSVSSAKLNHVREAFDFELAGSESGRIVTSSKKTNKDSTNIIPSIQEADASPYLQIGNMQDLQYGSVFNLDTKLNRYSLPTKPGREHMFPSFHYRMTLRTTLKKSIDSFHYIVSPILMTNLKLFNQRMRKGRPLEANREIEYYSGDLVLRKPVSQKTENIPENGGRVRTEKIPSRGVSDNLVKGIVKEKNVHEIEFIADKVYKIIEKRILIEKDRRGLL